MTTTALITGATGTVGRSLVSTLAGTGVRPRVLARDLARAHDALGDRADVVVGDLADPAALARALDGVDALFLACGNVADQVALESAAIDAASRSGVGRIVKLSARGAAPGARAELWRRHAAIEAHLTSSAVPAVVLRPSFLMTNLLAATAPIRYADSLPAPAGRSPIAMIDPVDVAAVGARALVDEAGPSGVIELTGPEAVTYGDVARQLSDVLGRPITYLDVDPGAAAATMAASGVPPTLADGILEIFADLRDGAQATADDAVLRTTGRRARSLRTFLLDHVATFGAGRVAGSEALAETTR